MNPDFTPKLLTVWREGYGLSRLRADALAGLTVAIVALPLAMALAIASGASPDKGLVTAIVAGFLISALGGSRVQVGGPTGAFVPMPALAAILLIVAWGMSEAERFRTLMRMELGERTLLLLTFGLTVLVDLTVAIGVGVTLASLLFMARMSEATGVLASDDSIEDPQQRATLPPGVEVFRIAGPMFFGVAAEMLEALGRIGSAPRAVILRLDRVPYMDSSGLNVLETFVRQAKARNARVILCDMPRPVWETLARSQPRFAGAERVKTLAAAIERGSKV